MTRDSNKELSKQGLPEKFRNGPKSRWLCFGLRRQKLQELYTQWAISEHFVCHTEAIRIITRYRYQLKRQFYTKTLSKFPKQTHVLLVPEIKRCKTDRIKALFNKSTKLFGLKFWSENAGFFSVSPTASGTYVQRLQDTRKCLRVSSYT